MNEEKNGDDSEYEEEESLVVVELSGIMETDLVSQVQECKVLGIDTEKPLLQLDNYIFQGEYEDAMGTCMMFEEKSLPETDEFNTEPQKELEYQYLTNKKVLMQRVFIKKPMEEETDPTTGGMLREKLRSDFVPQIRKDNKVSEKMEVETNAAQREPQPSTSSATDAQEPGTSSADTTSQPGTSLVKDVLVPGSSRADSISQPCTSLNNGLSQTAFSSDHSASLPVTSSNNFPSLTSSNNIAFLTISNNSATQLETTQEPTSPQPSTSSDGIT